jgi:hypothetical protein
MGETAGGKTKRRQVRRQVRWQVWRQVYGAWYRELEVEQSCGEAGRTAFWPWLG